METSDLSSSQARLKLTILNKKAEAKNSYEFRADMKGIGLPDEVIEILERLLKVTFRITGKVFSIGKIIVTELLDYVVKHPVQVVGLAGGLCAAFTLGIAVHALYCLIPGLNGWWIVGGLLSQLVQTIANALQAGAVFLPIAGVVMGEFFDRRYPGISENLEQLTKDFFELFSRIINQIKDEFDFSESNQAFA